MSDTMSLSELSQTGPGLLVRGDENLKLIPFGRADKFQTYNVKEADISQPVPIEGCSRTQLDLVPFRREDRLCQICRSIDFEYYKYHKLPRAVNYGNLTSIQLRSWCPFCRLITRCVTSRSRNQSAARSTFWLDNGEAWRLSIEYSPYDPTRSESSSNKYDLRDRANELDDVAYRFIVSSSKASSDSNRLGQIQYLEPARHHKNQRDFFGRRIDPNATDIELIKTWMSKCRHRHKESCSHRDLKRSSLPTGFRLIDVVTRKVIPAPKHTDYFALSYVWGEKAMLEENDMRPVVLRRELIVDEAGVKIMHLPSRLPKTIEDAMRLTRDVGCRYLWVDALCIIQDDEETAKHTHLSNMDAVYALARLTIVAGSGSHADCGLPGLYGSVRSGTQFVERVDGAEMATMLQTYSELENSPDLIWNQRGWTLQEKLLSKRLLLFTEQQVYFKCSESIWSEQAWLDIGRISEATRTVRKYRWSAIHLAEDKRRKTMTEQLMDKMEEDVGGTVWRHLHDKTASFRDAGSRDFYNPNAVLRECTQRTWFKSYTSAIQECTQRNLKDHNDLMFSINGIFRLLGDGPGQFFRGLPQAEFAKSLLWHPELGSQLKVALPGWPSWSWASWYFDKHGVAYGRPENEALLTLLFHRSLLRKLEKSQSETSMTPAVATSESATSTLAKPAATTSASTSTPGKNKTEDSMHVPLFVDVNIQSCLAFFPGFVPRPKYMYYCDKGEVKAVSDSALTIERYRDELEHRFPKARRLSYSFPLLLMESPVVRFRIGRPLVAGSTANDTSTGLYELVDAHDRCVGEVWASGRMASRYASRRIDCLTLSRTWRLEQAEIHSNYRPRWKFNSLADGLEQAWEALDKEDAEELAQEMAALFKRPLRAMDLFRELRKGEKRGAEGLVDTIIDKFLRKEFEVDAATGDTSLGATLTNLIGAVFDDRSNDGQDRDYVERHRDGPLLSVLSAVKGEPIPQFLWKVVEVLVIEWEGDVAWRVGTGKIAYNAWKEALPFHKRVMLA